MPVALGLEIRDGSAAALAVDETGAVIARALVESTGDLAVAALESVDTVAGAAGSGPLGIAANAGDVSPVAILTLLKRKYTGPFLHVGATASGTAAAVAEAW